MQSTPAQYHISGLSPGMRGSLSSIQLLYVLFPSSFFFCLRSLPLTTKATSFPHSYRLLLACAVDAVPLLTSLYKVGRAANTADASLSVHLFAAMPASKPLDRSFNS